MPDRRVVVIARPFGQLGNRLVLFAHFIAAALEHDLLILNPAFNEYAHLFPSTADDVLCRFPPGDCLPPQAGAREAMREAVRAGANALHRLQVSGRDVGLIRLEDDECLDLNSEAFLGMVSRHPVLLIEGWFFRNQHNCERHQDSIRRFLTPHPRTLDRAREPIDKARASGKLVVGVHVRRGDYEWHAGGRFFFSHAEYGRMMSGLHRGPNGQDVTFFVCSDEPVPPQWLEGLDVISSSWLLMEDLYGLAACDFLVGPPSTFTRWASFYGDVPVHWIENVEDQPSYDSFHTPGLGSGRAVRPWADPASA
jgi:hypothetical protein